MSVRAHNPHKESRAPRRALTGLDGQEVVQLVQQLQQGRLLLGLTELQGHRTGSQQGGAGDGGSVSLAGPPWLHCQCQAARNPSGPTFCKAVGAGTGWMGKYG